MNKKLLNDFPTLKKYTYLDSAALVLKPKAVVEAINYYYNELGISTRTSETKIANEIKNKYYELKNQISLLCDAKEKEIILTKNTSDSLNYFFMMFEYLLKKDDEIIVSSNSHASNITPLINMAQKVGAKVIVDSNILKHINSKTILVSLSQKGNAFDDENDHKQISKITRERGIFLLNDAAQAIISEKVSLKESDAIAFSANKIFGPTSMGVLIIKEEYLEKFKAKRFGGGSIDYINNELVIKTKDYPYAHEVGSWDFAGIYGFSAALTYFSKLDQKEMNKYILELRNYLAKEAKTISNLEYIESKNNSVFLFRIKNIDSQEIANYLGTQDVYVRSGFFCNPIFERDNNKSYVRVSLAFYNTKEDIDILIKHLKEGGDFIVI